MLDDEIVLKNCYYWAHKMICKGIDFNELVSVGYVVGKPLRDARLLKDWIHFSMLKFIKEEMEIRQQCIDPLDDCFTHIVEASNQANDFSVLYKTIATANLSNREKDAIELTFFKNKTQTEAAQLLGISQQSVFVYVKRGLDKITKLYKKKERS